MKETLYTVDQVSEQLGMHPKTIRRFIRAGKLKANKVGNQYRITGHDLSILTEGDSNTKMMVEHHETQKGINVSMVVEINDVSIDGNTRISNMLMATMNHKDSSFGKASFQSKYYPNDKKLKLMIWGSVKFSSLMLENIEMLTED